MREAESQYWDKVAVHKGVEGDFNDNIWKRAEIVSRILKHRPAHARVLEIGCGHGLGAAAINMLMLGNFHYTGTDVSVKFCDFMNQRWKLRAVQTDILKLPDGPFDMVWAFDTLEHVRPEDRAAGYLEINRVLAEHGVVVLNLPLNESAHEDEFDWGIADQDVTELAKAIGGRVTLWDAYHIEEVERSYAWVEIRR